MMPTRLWMGLLLLGACGTPSDATRDRLEIQLAQRQDSYIVGDSVAATAVEVAADGTVRRVSGVAWRSLQPEIAVVSGSGKIYMLAVGDATIEAEAGSRSSRIAIAVRGIRHRLPVTRSEVWRAADSPHIVEGELLVSGTPAPALTIEPGTTVQFTPASMLVIGGFEPGRLVASVGGDPVTFQGDSAGRGTWVGIVFNNDLRSELRNVLIRHCGGASRTGATQFGCLSVSRGEILLEGVSIIEPHDFGLRMESGAIFAPGSRNLSITGGDGPIAALGPEAAVNLPRGGSFTGNARNEFHIGTGRLKRSGSWDLLGPAWRVTGQVQVGGPANPLLRIPAGAVVLVDSTARFQVGSEGPGRLVVGALTGPPVVFQPLASHWFGIEIGDSPGPEPSAFIRTTLSACGSAIQGARQPCLKVFGAQTALLVDSLTIRDAAWNAIEVAGAGFAPGSKNLTVTGSGGVPLSISVNSVATIPSGDLRGNADDVIEVTSQDIGESATWRDPGVPYRALGGLSITHPSNDPVLTLAPGVRIQVGTNGYVVVGGALRAVGTADRPVIFSGLPPGMAGSWYGIQIGVSGDSRTRLDQAQVLDAGQGDPNLGGAIRFQVDPGGVITNTTVRRSATCGIVIFEAPWTDDYTAPSFHNVFSDLGGPTRCRLP